jgi:hypothetical protein
MYPPCKRSHGLIGWSTRAIIDSAPSTRLGHVYVASSVVASRRSPMTFENVVDFHLINVLCQVPSPPDDEPGSCSGSINQPSLPVCVGI